MTTNARRTTGADSGPGVGDRLPSLTLPRADDGGRVALRSPQHGSPVVVFPATRDAGRRYLRDLAAADREFRDWSGRPLVVLPTDVELRAYIPAGGADSLTILADPEGVAHRRFGVGEATAAVFIADRWGQIYFTARAVDESELPEPAEIEDWLRYLATQCPECGVPDEPGRGEWEA